MKYTRGMGRAWRLGLACLSAGLLPGKLMADPVRIAAGGEPRAAIVIATRATRAAQLGAYELQWHLRKITGATLPVVKDNEPVTGARILVGESAAVRAAGLKPDEFGEQEYAIRFLPETLILAGKDAPDFGAVDYQAGAGLPDLQAAQATCYAVYDFLERFCGVRWYAPTEAGMVCPTQATLMVSGEDIRRAPAFRYRVGQGEADYQKRVYLTPYKELWFDPSYDGRDVRLWNRRLRMGGEAFNTGHSFDGYHDLREEHPDWFAQGYTRPEKMCYANEAFFRRVVADARESLDTGRPNRLNSRQVGHKYVALVPEDGGGKGGGFCQCPACKALLQSPPNPAELEYFEPVDLYSTSNYLFDFINRLARELRSSHPHAYVSTLSYPNYTFPPAREPLEPNVAVTICLRTRNWWVPFTERRDRAVYRAWIDEAKTSGRPLYVWLYYTFPSEILGLRMFPGFFARTAARQLKMFARDGVQGAFLNGMGEQVDTYVTFKLLDDPSQDIEKLLHEFFTLYYGAAGAALERIYGEMEEVYGNPASYPESVRTATSRYTHQTEALAWSCLGTPERMQRWQGLMDEANERAATALEKQRVAAFEAGIWKPMTAAAANYRMRVRNEPLREALRKRGAPRLRVPRVPDAGGDAGAVDWTKAAELVNRLEASVGAWPTVDGYPSERVIQGRVAHDGKYLYVRLMEEQFEATGLLASDNIEMDDTWEIYVSCVRGREEPFRRLWMNSRGDTLARCYVDNKAAWESGARARSEVTGNRWTVRVALPLEGLVEGGMTPGTPYYINFVRARAGETANGQYATLTWSPTFVQGAYYQPRNAHFMSWKVWDTSALGEIMLAP